MKKNRLVKVLTSAALTAAMVMSMGMAALAAPTDTIDDGNPPAAATTEPQNVTIKKQLYKRSGVYGPATDFTFTVTPVGELTHAKVNGVEIGENIPETGVTIADGGKISSTPDSTNLTETDYQVGTMDLIVSTTAFPAPGRYRYLVKEVNSGYKGITYDSSEKWFDVFVNSDKVPYAYTFVDTANPDAKDDGVFTNKYGVNDDKDPDGTVNDLTIRKQVTGNQGNKDEDFTFKVKIDGDAGEQYYMTFSGSNNKVTLTSGTESDEFTLRHDQSVTISGLSENDEFAVTEVIEDREGYTTSIQVGTNDPVETKSISGQKISANTEVVVTNHKEVTTPTGIILSFAPYILLVAIAGVFAVSFLRKKREEF